jgi:hypothetical protein
MPATLAAWGVRETVLTMLAVVVLIVLIVLMSTKKPGPQEPPADSAAGPGDKPSGGQDAQSKDGTSAEP